MMARNPDALAAKEHAARLARELPSKESQIFKTVLKFFEVKQYKKGVKAAESILKKFPSHGETLAMKGLFYSNIPEKKDEAHEIIKKGLMNDLTSPVCWHVFGLYHRGERNIEEAAKCYANALKYDKENTQILRDFSFLQLQMRNYEAFSLSRHQLLLARPNLRANWVHLAVSYHLLKDYKNAELVLDLFDSVTEDTTTGLAADFENSEVLLYKNHLIEESGDKARALEHLNSIRTKVLDQRAWSEAKARILLKSDRHPEAEVVYSRLIAENPDSLTALEGLREARGLGGENLDRSKIERVVRMCKELSEKYPRSHVIRRLPIRFLTGDEFVTHMDAYLVPLLRKGAPSLLVSLKDLLADEAKCDAIERLALGYYGSLKANRTFSSNSTEIEPPTALLWVIYFLAQFYDRKRNLTRALEYIDEAIAHSPTVVELYMTKARIYKHAGDLALAMKYMNDARQMDLQDRHVNSKCAKYMFANNCVKEAEETVSLFTKAESADPLQDMVTMQCLWFAHSSAQAHVRMGSYGRALKRYQQIEKHFVEFYEDQFDFHSYGLRRLTMRAYMDLLDASDNLRTNRIYIQAAKEAADAYLALFDGPPTPMVSKDGVDLSALSESERKKMLRKARKAELASNSAAGKSDAAATTAANAAAKGKRPATADPDPDGKKFTEGVDYLAEGLKFVKMLQTHASKDIDGWLLGCEINIRKNKLALALQSLVRAKQINPTHPKVHSLTVRLHLALFAHQNATPSTLDSRVLLIAAEELAEIAGAKLTDTTSLAAFNATFSQNNAESVEHVIAAAQAYLAIDPSNLSTAAHLLSTIGVSATQGFNLQNAITAHKILLWTCHDEPAAAAFKTIAATAYPLSTYLQMR